MSYLYALDSYGSYVNILILCPNKPLNRSHEHCKWQDMHARGVKPWVPIQRWKMTMFWISGPIRVKKYCQNVWNLQQRNNYKTQISQQWTSRHLKNYCASSTLRQIICQKWHRWWANNQCRCQQQDFSTIEVTKFN